MVEYVLQIKNGIMINVDVSAKIFGTLVHVLVKIVNI